MLSRERIERYRRMRPEERYAEFRELMELAWKTLLALPAVERERRLDVARREHALGNEALLKGLMRHP